MYGSSLLDECMIMIMVSACIQVVRRKPFVYEDNLEMQHKRIMEECVEDFRSSCMGTHSIKEANEQNLCKKIDAEYQGIKRSNNIGRRVTQIGVAGVAGAAAVGVGALLFTAGGAAIPALVGLAAVAAKTWRP